MYASNVDQQKLTFFVSGKLWGRSLVMGDKETGSEWSHILGRAMAGPMKDNSLKIIPSTMTNWSTWVKQHPETTATMIKPTARNFVTEMLNHGPEFGLGLVHKGKARFWRFDRLQLQPVANDELAQLALVVYFDRPSRTPVAWQRQTPGHLLTFNIRGEEVLDEQTQSTWDLRKGVAIKGALKGTQLKAVPAIVSFTRSWDRFHPDSSHWKPTALGNDAE